jgi:hypothetical protein
MRTFPHPPGRAAGCQWWLCTRCAREIFPAVELESRGSGAASFAQRSAEALQFSQPFGFSASAQVFEMAERFARSTIHLAVEALDVDLVSFAERLDKRISRATDGAGARREARFWRVRHFPTLLQGRYLACLRHGGAENSPASYVVLP